MYAERPRLGALGSAMPVSPRNWYIGCFLLARIHTLLSLLNLGLGRLAGGLLLRHIG